jgi:type II secretory pathway component GspD/PulD (secretin)
MKALFILTLLLVVAPACLAQQEQNHFEVYPLGFADGPSAVEMVNAMVGSTGNVSLDEKNHRLLVFTTEEKHGEVANLMQKLDVAPKNVRIDVRFNEASRRQDTGAGIGASGGIVREEGLTRTRFRVSPRIENTTLTTSSDVTQTLLVASGREGVLRVGESVPYVDWLVDYGLQWGYLQQRISYRDVGSSLIVEPTVIGDGPFVRIRLTPELRGLVDGNVYRTRFARVATEVTVQDGQTFQIGGLDKDSEFYSRFLVGFDRGGNRQALDITLTPHIVSASGGP